ncbi:hypothetical protein BDZ97DRAFT_64419 [Flammula alnicola]|nr:hypothetical protein BDZ97DRAFT_64419 [Flammula alnicola]
MPPAPAEWLTQVPDDPTGGVCAVCHPSGLSLWGGVTIRGVLYCPPRQQGQRLLQSINFQCKPPVPLERWGMVVLRSDLAGVNGRRATSPMRGASVQCSSLVFISVKGFFRDGRWIGCDAGLLLQGGLASGQEIKKSWIADGKCRALVRKKDIDDIYKKEGENGFTRNGRQISTLGGVR